LVQKNSDESFKAQILRQLAEGKQAQLNGESATVEEKVEEPDVSEAFDTKNSKDINITSDETPKGSFQKIQQRLKTQNEQTASYSDTISAAAHHLADGEKNNEKPRQRTKKQEDVEQITVAVPLRQNEQKARQNSKKKREDKMVHRIASAVIAALVLLMVLGGFLVYRYINTAVKPLDPNSDQQITINIPLGSSNKEIGNILEKGKVIKSGIVFNYYTKFKSLAGFRGGYYNFSPSQTLDEIAKILQSGGTDEPQAAVAGKILIPEGYSIDQIAQAVSINVNEKKKPKSKFTTDEFKKIITNPDFIAAMVQKYPKLLTSASEAADVRYVLEGYLFPATYDYTKDTKLQDLVEEMIATTNVKLSPYYEIITSKGYTVQEVLTLASLVEKEGIKSEDRKKIAQVFLNRLAIDMPLQSDISVLYALNEHKEQLSNEDTKVDSPYNLYIHTGYGPGPFDSPSLESIQAVLEPTPTDDLYFLADVKTGKVYFAKTYDEHLKLAEEHINN
jgi:UPF0755 protein